MDSSPHLLYQPRYDCRTGQLVGARLHLEHPERPDSLVLVDASPQHLTRLETAMHQLRDWQHTHARPLALSVGCTQEALVDPALQSCVSRLLLADGISGSNLELNILSALRNFDATTAHALQHLKGLGLRFGINSASQTNVRLAWTRRMPLDFMEVPAGMIQDVATDPEGVAIVRALISRAHKLGIQVSAKGVHQTLNASILVANGCDFIQGPLMGAPMPAADFDALLAQGQGLDPSLLGGPSPERTLLLVDDEENILSSLRRLLRREGYTILTAVGGHKGLEVLATHQVDVIISDQRMPGMTGVEFLRKAKDMQPNSVRMVLSGYTDLQSVTDAINEGAIYKFLTKPWDDAMLRANIEEAFRRKALSDENNRLGEQVHNANRELALMNERLQSVVAERERRLSIEEAALNLAQEALAALPIPILGIDPGGLIAFANPAADALFPLSAPLIGLQAETSLPTEVRDCLNTSETTPLRLNGHSFQVRAHPLGASPEAPPRGTLLSFIPEGVAP
ncbi:EAL domain-containing protein [Zoogloea sp.]|uniref:EAL domain-containing protein n=1 Tax=Zoogloea sp. TaxID=49181 RepID=UPI0035B3EAEB